MPDSSLTDKQREILRRQERILETGKKILSSMSKGESSGPYKVPVSIENMTLQIFHDMNTIAQLAGGRRTARMMQACYELQNTFRMLQRAAEGSLSEQRDVMKWFLDFAVRVVTTFNEKEGPLDMEIDLQVLLQKFKLKLKKGVQESKGTD